MQWLKELRVLRQLVKPEYLRAITGLQQSWVKNVKNILTENYILMKPVHLEIDINKYKYVQKRRTIKEIA